ncbi:MAG: gamma-glutamylcyclotransferase [Pseudohaliea sp.]
MAEGPVAPGDGSAWVFGYGSLIYKVDFPYLDRRPASIEGWERRFWQGSHDHRGTPQAPGRVVTLIEAPGALCRGVAYRVDPAVFDHLDHREKNGYVRHRLAITLDGAAEPVPGLIYVATADNPAFLGSAPLAELAAHIAQARGPSGSNRDYLFELARALRALGSHDPHVHELALRVDAVLGATRRPAEHG